MLIRVGSDRTTADNDLLPIAFSSSPTDAKLLLAAGQVVVVTFSALKDEDLRSIGGFLTSYFYKFWKTRAAQLYNYLIINKSF
jgi:hypothetical protein